MKRHRLAAVLVLINVSLAVTVIALDEWRNRANLDVMQRSEDGERLLRKYPKANEVKVGFDCDSVCCGSSYSTKFIYIANGPAAIAVGWYGRPFGACPQSLVRVLNDHAPFESVSVRKKIWFYDALLVVAIGLQWWLLGRWAGAHPKRYHRLAVIIAAAAGILCPLSILLPVSMGQFSAHPFALILEFLPVGVAIIWAIAWVWICVLLLVSIGRRLATVRRNRLQAAQ